MADMIPSLERLIEQFRHMPSVGKKTATRMAFSVLDYTDEEAQSLIEAIADAKRNITSCPVCFGISEGGLCSVCSDDKRDKSVICVVEDYRAVISLERVRDYHGLYHVLHGVLSPLEGIGPDKLRIRELLERLNNNETREIIVATNPDVEGEATAVYLFRLLMPMGLKISRLAYGMPVGGDLEYTDEGTLSRAITGRRDMNT
ncbi:MAG: recombination mediator RecR [Eubacteriales bacterium]